MKTMVDSHKMSGTNAQRLTMLPDNDFVTFYETDTNSEYEWKGSEWVQTKANGSSLIRIVASDVLPPENSKYTDTLNILIATGATAQTSGDISGYSHGVIQITAITAIDTLLIQGYLDAAQTKLSDAILVYSTAGTATTASALAATGTYYIRDMAFNGLKVTKTGANGIATVEISLKS